MLTLIGELEVVQVPEVNPLNVIPEGAIVSFVELPEAEEALPARSWIPTLMVSAPSAATLVFKFVAQPPETQIAEPVAEPVTLTVCPFSEQLPEIGNAV